MAGSVRANDVILTSDARLKSDIRPIRGALRKLTKLRGVEFSWKGKQGRRTAGVVAQEVEAVAPELVRREPDDGLRGVNLGGVLGLLVEAFKELAAENSELRLRVDALERAEG